MNKKICQLTCFILQKIIFSLFISLTIFTTCSLEGDISAKRPKPGENNPSVIPDPIYPNNNTFIVFDNTQGICTVSVYNDYRRRDEDKIAEIPAGNNSEKIGCTPGNSVSFYFSYRVTIKGNNDFSLNYIPEIGKDHKLVRIDADTTTTIKIPTLSESISSPDTLLSNNSYIFIQNNSSYSFELHQGTSKLKPDNISSPLVNNGERAQYTINPGPASNYRLLVGVDYKELSGLIVNFEAGHIYNFDFKGSISLVSDTALKFKNINGVTIPQSPAAPIVITSNESLALRWSAVESATAYEIWMSTVNDSVTASKYGTDIVASLTATISNLNNKTTYYIWLKAKNSFGTSGFSTAATGTPSASTVKPPDPQTAPTIIARNGQLTVSWQAVIDTDVYEVWTGTTNNAQNAIKQGGDISGFSTVITGLNNGTTYYIWIKAKNHIGSSDFSPSATGKPLGTPGTPILSPEYRQLEVTWTTVAGAERYEVYYGIGTPTTLATTTAETTATITGLTVNTTYNVRLRAINTNGVSEYGSIASSVPNNYRTPGLYRGFEKIGTQNYTAALSWISSNVVNGDDFYIVLGENVSISPSLSTDSLENNLYFSGKTVGITLLGYGSEKIVTLNANGSIYVHTGVTLTLDKNISLVGLITNRTYILSIIGTLIINDGAKIVDNTSSIISDFSSFSSCGGGVYVNYDGILIMNGGEISGNTAFSSSTTDQTYSYGSYGGGIYVNSGTFIMNGGKIYDNTTSSSLYSYGGGVYVASGTFTMNGGEIYGNSASSLYSYGGGIYVNSGTFIMNGGKIYGNSASSSSSSFMSRNSGGGVYIDSGTFTMNGGEIYSNTTISTSTTNNSNMGGGVSVNSNGTFTMTNGNIYNNTSHSGGGLYVKGGTFTLTSGEISDNIALMYGGGILITSDENTYNGIFTMNGGKISNNIASTYASSAGGGVAISGIFTMNGGEIFGNTSTSGGGVSVSYGNFTMYGGNISGNTAYSVGGGVYARNLGAFYKTGGGIITGYASDTVNGNVVKDSSSVVQNNKGHAVYNDSPVRRRETTAGADVNISHILNGAAGGWEN